jgi:hypothetical protein
LFVEVMYEAGHSSVMQVDSKDEALAAMAEQHRRAKAGELNGPQGGQADRVVQGYIYDVHPNDFNPGGSLTSDELNSLLPDLIDALADENGVVPVGTLAAAVRDLTHPMISASDRSVHDSMFRMEENDVITSAEIDDASEPQDDLSSAGDNG